MARRRAISPEDQPKPGVRLPSLYKALSPLLAERHGRLGLSSVRDYSFAARANAIPLTVDEFPTAMRDYPIVIAAGPDPVPVALMGLEKGVNPNVESDGTWSQGKYVPAYLRRWPFMLLEAERGSDRAVLCADMGSIMFEDAGQPDRMLFQGDGKPTPLLEEVLTFCKQVDAAVRRTRAMMQELVELELIQPSNVRLARGDKSLEAKGFSVIAEDRLRDLPDAELAGLARRGVLTMATAHQLSLGRFVEAWR